MSDKDFLPKPDDTMGWLHVVSEECGEVVQAIGKLMRFGAMSHDTRILSGHKRITNGQKLLMEMRDAIGAMDGAFHAMKLHGGYDMSGYPKNYLLESVGVFKEKPTVTRSELETMFKQNMGKELAQSLSIYLANILTAFELDITRKQE